MHISTLALTVVAVGGGILAGIATAQSLMAGPDTATKLWQEVVRDGNHASPWTLAHQMDAGRLPVPAVFTPEFLATHDSSGKPLSGGCTYVITGTLQPALWWSVSTGSTPENAARPASVASGDVVVEPDGSVRLTLSPEPQPGNWLSAPGKGSFDIRLRLFLPVANHTNSPALKINTEDCP